MRQDYQRAKTINVRMEATVGAPLGPAKMLVRPEGFEPPTLGFEARYSIQLS